MRLISVVGRERLSRLFEFDLLLSRKGERYTDDELDDLLKAPCAIALGPRPGDVVHGLLSAIEVLDADADRRRPSTSRGWCRRCGCSPSRGELAHLPEHQRPRHGAEDPRGVRPPVRHRLRDPQHQQRQEPRSASTSCSTRRATGTSSSAGSSRRASSTGSRTARAARSSSSPTRTSRRRRSTIRAAISYREREQPLDGRPRHRSGRSTCASAGSRAGLRAGLQLPDAGRRAVRERDGGQAAGLRDR